MEQSVRLDCNLAIRLTTVAPPMSRTMRRSVKSGWELFKVQRHNLALRRREALRTVTGLANGNKAEAAEQERHTLTPAHVSKDQSNRA